jgi:hypothetical protein
VEDKKDKRRTRRGKRREKRTRKDKEQGVGKQGDGDGERDHFSLFQVVPGQQM